MGGGEMYWERPADLVGVAVAGAQEQHRHGRVSAQAAADLEARLVGKHHVQQHQVGAATLELLARLPPAPGMPHPEALRLQEVPHQLCDLVVVLDDQDRHPGVLAAHATPVSPKPARPSTPRGLFQQIFIAGSRGCCQAERPSKA